MPSRGRSRRPSDADRRLCGACSPRLRSSIRCSHALRFTRGQIQTTKAPLDFDQAVDYIKRIRTIFEDKPARYHAFLAILSTYHDPKQQTSIRNVYKEVTYLAR